MDYWFGYRVSDKKSEKCLLGPYESYESANKQRIKNSALEMLQTQIFTADSEQEAQDRMDVEVFTKI